MRRITQHKRIWIGSVHHGYRGRFTKSSIAIERTFWIPIFGAVLFLTPLVGTAFAASFPTILPTPLVTESAFAAVTPLKLNLESIEISHSSPLLSIQHQNIYLGREENPDAPVIADEKEEEYATNKNKVSDRINSFNFTSNEAWRSQVVSHALTLLGQPYVWGGVSIGGFDCSGLVQYVFSDAGISVPRTAREMYYTLTPIPFSELKPGDLLFFRNPDHVGIWIGNGEFIHASSGRKRVSISSIASDQFYQRRFIGCRRI